MEYLVPVKIIFKGKTIVIFQNHVVSCVGIFIMEFTFMIPCIHRILTFGQSSSTTLQLRPFSPSSKITHQKSSSTFSDYLLGFRH